MHSILFGLLSTTENANVKGHVTCNSDFDLDGGKSELLRVAHALKLPNPSKLMDKSPTTDVVLGADKHSGRNVSLKIFHHWDDKMVGMLKGEAARDEYDLERHTSEGDLLDIGGHIGVTALFFHKLHPTSQVYIFEPAPLNIWRSMLLRTVQTAASCASTIAACPTTMLLSPLSTRPTTRPRRDVQVSGTHGVKNPSNIDWCTQ
jgi:hypothetical protein